MSMPCNALPMNLDWHAARGNGTSLNPEARAVCQQVVESWPVVIASCKGRTDAA
jgi:hypothetical protein